MSPYADDILTLLFKGNQAIVPPLWLYEVVAVISKAQRRGILPSVKAQRFLENLQTLGILVEDVVQGRILHDVRALAVRYGLAGYDASYLELAKRKTIPLATLDDDLRSAAIAANVALVAP